VAEQSRVLVHNSNLWHNEWAGELALLLVEKTKELGGMGYAVGGATAPDAAPPSVDEKGYPSSGLKVFFSNSGTEANEGALKFARKWGKQTSQDKVEIVSFRDGFHGRSMGALSGTWNPKYQAPFAPLIPGFVMGCLNGIGALQHTITEKTCGVIVEPIQASPYSRTDTTITDSSALQGEGGIVEAKEEFLRAIRKRCDEVGALLIFDEIQVSPQRRPRFSD
jgi:acetylornithine aminotransferase